MTFQGTHFKFLSVLAFPGNWTNDAGVASVNARYCLRYTGGKNINIPMKYTHASPFQFSFYAIQYRNIIVFNGKNIIKMNGRPIYLFIPYLS